MGLRTAAIGTGFSMPPVGRPLPLYEAPAERLASSEARMLATANAVLAELGLNPMPTRQTSSLAMQISCVPGRLDHYQRDGADWLGPSCVAEGGLAPYWPDGEGRKVFAYLKASHAAHAAVLRALVDEGCHVLAYMPEVAAGGVPPSSVNACCMQRRCRCRRLWRKRICACAMQARHAGTVATGRRAAADAAVAYRTIPRCAARCHVWRRLQRRIACPGWDWRAVLRPLLNEAGYRDAARGFAARHAGFSPQQLNALLVERITLLLDGRHDARR
jgi:hypothetical protein